MQRGTNLLNSYGVKKTDTKATETIQKSFNINDLVAEQVEVKKKDGTTYMATRWVNPKTNESHNFGGKYSSHKDIPGKTPAEKINHIVENKKSAGRAEQHRDLMSMGIYDSKQHGILLGDATYPKYLQKKELIEHDFSKFHKEEKEAAAGDTNVPTTKEGKTDFEHGDFDINQLKDDIKNKDFNKIKKEQKEFLKQKFNITYKEKWETYNLSLDQIMILGRPKSLIAYGTGGLGKTWDLERALANNNVNVYDEELHLDPSEYDAVKISGNTSPSDLYNLLYINKDKLMIFDDCDSMWGDQDAENILKAALDTSGDGTIRYANPRALSVDEEGKKTYPPKQFKFNGQIIFISNMRRDQLPQPIVDSRARTIDLSMSMDETLDKMDTIKDKIKFHDKNNETITVSKEQREAVINFLREHKQFIDIGKVNGRTLGNLALFASSTQKRAGKATWDKQLQADFEKRAAILLDIA